MACSVVVEYLLFPRMSVKRADKPASCLARPIVASFLQMVLVAFETR